jgi:hypothetical protein
MRLLRKRGAIALLMGVLLLISSAYIFVWTWSVASLRCVACDCRYELNSGNPDCRLPALLLILSLVTFIGAIGALCLAWFQRNRTLR